jgi:hypothetical protein
MRAATSAAPTDIAIRHCITAHALTDALMGVEFIAETGSGAGVRLWKLE